MMFYRSSTEYISVGCSRTPHSLDWGHDQRLCFGACNALAVAEPCTGGDSYRITETLHHHTDAVLSCRWLSEQPSGRCLPLALTGSADRTAALWDLSAPAAGRRPVSELRGHAGPVTLVDGMVWQDGDGGQVTSCVTASADGTLRVWQRRPHVPQALDCRQVVDLAGGLVLSVRLCLLPGCAVPFIAAGTDDARLQLLVRQPDGLFSTALRLAGHEDWIRCIDTVLCGAELLLATAGQDTFVRVWTVRVADSRSAVGREDGPITLRSQSLSVQVAADSAPRVYEVRLDSVLAGHEGWVYGVRWQPGARRLASASMDKCLIVWEPDASDGGLWTEAARLGEVGGNTLGLYGCCWRPDGRALASHGYRGAVHIWQQRPEPSGAGWRPLVSFGGHCGDVSDLSWEPDGAYLLTCSLDQTTRLHGCWNTGDLTWHELSRPQIHGFDLFCISAITGTLFASGAEEKVVRAFQMPSTVLQNLTTLCEADVSHLKAAGAAEGAAVPSLGLTNKPVYSGEAQPSAVESRDHSAESYFVRTELTQPPTEEMLLQNTLWPEVHKLYGHGYELVSLAADPSGRLLASSCRAARPEHAAILLWDTATWRKVDQLAGAHQLTVVHLAFSPNGRHLLAVSRDRSWSVYTADTAGRLRLSARSPAGGGHTRIIWSCSWLADSSGFVTGSRDGQVLLWRRCDDQWARCGDPYRPGAAVTAVAISACGLLALGLESGHIQLLSWTEPGGWRAELQLGTSSAHHLAVRRLAFRPSRTQPDRLLLASCSADHALKLHLISATPSHDSS